MSERMDGRFYTRKLGNVPRWRGQMSSLPCPPRLLVVPELGPGCVWVEPHLSLNKLNPTFRRLSAMAIGSGSKNLGGFASAVRM